MTRQELFEMLEIEDPSQFQYFEQMADLLECPKTPEYEDFKLVLSEIDQKDFCEILENYLNELDRSLPEDELLAELLENIRQRMNLFASDLSDKKNRCDLSRELYKFREWYTAPGGAKVDGKPMSILDASCCYREEKLGAAPHSYEFPGAAGYDLEELTYNLGSFEKIDI